MNRLLFIVNPEAGRGLGRKIGERIPALIERDNFCHDLVYTRERGEAQSRAQQTEADVVVAVGGDGTINEVVNGIGDSGKKLAIVPAGSGNDVIKSLMIPRDIKQALEILRKPIVRMVDIATVEWFSNLETGSGSFSRKRLFLNGVGMGFDASVARHVTSIRWLRGTILYLVAVLRTLRDFSSPDFRIQVDGGQISSGKKLLVAIGNGVCAGGGFYLTPQASVDDGLLDMCSIHSMRAMGILGIIPKVLQGNHLSLQGIDYRKGQTFSISSHDGFSIHADGEVLSDRANKVYIAVKPRGLGVMVPPSRGDGAV